VVFSAIATSVVTIDISGGDITFTISQGTPVRAQLSHQWHLATLAGGVLTLRDSEFRQTASVEVAKAQLCVCTRHFLFAVSEGALTARFLPAKDSGCHLLDGVVGLQLVDAEADEVLVWTESRMAVLRLIEEGDTMDDLFVKLIDQRLYDRVIYLSEGIGREVPFEAPIYEQLHCGNFMAAMEILEHCPCDLKNPFGWIVAQGGDRFALHVILRFGQFTDTIDLIQTRIARKYELFINFSSDFRRIFFRPSLNDPLPEVPPALQFRTRMSAAIEDTTLELLANASRLDCPVARVFSFSMAFTALLSQLRAANDTIEEDMPLPGCIQLRRLGNRRFCLTRDGGVNFPCHDLAVASIEVFGSSLFVIDRRLRVHRCDPPSWSWAELKQIHPTIKIATNTDSIAFLSIFGSIYFDDGSSILAQYIDIALGKAVIFALDEQGVVFRIVDRRAHKILLKPFISAIGSAGDLLVCFSPSGQVLLVNSENQIREVPIDFEVSQLRSFGDEVAVIGPGRLLIVCERGDHQVLNFSDRIGRISDVFREGDDYVLSGSFGWPMKVFRRPIPSDQLPSFAEMKCACEVYDTDFMLSLFDREPWRTFIYVQARRFEEVVKSEAVAEVVPYFDELDSEAVPEIIHAVIQQGKFHLLADQHLRSAGARKCFLRYSGDPRALSPEQQLAALPVIEVPGKKIPDYLANQLMQKVVNRAALVISLRFKEGRLLAFSCGHVLNEKDFEVGIEEVHRLCSEARYPLTGRTLADTYAQPKIPLQCPRCLHGFLATYFREK
jgi:hypothetical protein